jgi:hypothetical protein
VQPRGQTAAPKVLGAKFREPKVRERERADAKKGGKKKEKMKI